MYAERVREGLTPPAPSFCGRGGGVEEDRVGKLAPSEGFLTMPLSERIAGLRQYAWERSGQFFERGYHLSVGRARYRDQPEPLQTALAFAHLCENVTVNLRPEELIVGEVPRREEPLTLAADAPPPDPPVYWLAEARFQPWERATVEVRAHSAGIMTGHMQIDNERVLTEGLAGMVATAEEHLAATPAAETDRRLFYQAAIIAMRGAMRFAERHAELAERLATEDPEHAADLLEIARICRKVPAQPAESFREALQATWFMHMLVAAETGPGHGCFCPGRVDRFWWPAYERDKVAGRLTREQALELIEAFFVKMNDWTANDNPSNIILGGQDAAGNEFTNDLTFLCLEASREVHMVNPSVHLAVSEKTSDRVLEEACETLLRGDGYPAMFNDEMILEGLERAGVAREDAVEYVPCSCVEITVGGKTNAWVASGYVNMAKLLEFALNEGKDPLTGRQAGLRTLPLKELDSFEKLYDAVKAQMRYVVLAHLSMYEKLQEAQKARPFPLLSCVIRDCLERGRNLGDGDTAARYVFTEPEAVGMTNLADSLAAIQKLVYEEQRVSLADLREALAADFVGHEQLRLMLLNDAPKFGNDDDYVDHFMVELTQLWHHLILSHRGVLGGNYLPGYLAWMMHVALGEYTGALPDGRRARLPLADCVGPAQGRDKRGPTAVVASLSKLDLRDALAGVVHNFRFEPRVLKGESRGRFIQFLRTLFAQGGAQAQINVISPQILREAQHYPERYRDLVVRVAGFSALFVPLAAHVQEEIIERTTHEAV